MIEVVANVAQATVLVAQTPAEKSVGEKLADIIAKHDAWHDGTRKASSQELYSVLAECLKLMVTVKVDRGYAALTDKLVALGVKHNEGTSLQTRIVRAVFKHDSRNLGRYAAIIKLADVKGVKPEGFVAWLNDNGGIDAARKHFALPKAATASNDKLYRVATDHLRNATTLATVNGKLLANVSETLVSGYVVSIARVNAAGDYEIVGASTDATALRKAMVNWGQHVVDTNKSTAAADAEKASVNGLAAMMIANAA